MGTRLLHKSEDLGSSPSTYMKSLYPQHSTYTMWVTRVWQPAGSLCASVCFGAVSSPQPCRLLPHGA